jgi:hypothetical protein
MRRLRRGLGLVALVWLSCQVGLLATVPIVLWAGFADELPECTCAHGDHAMCPMHHKPVRSATICLLRSAGTGGAAVLASIFSFVGVLTSPTLVMIPSPALSPVSIPVTTVSRGPTAPEPPPPRA